MASECRRSYVGIGATVEHGFIGRLIQGGHFSLATKYNVACGIRGDSVDYYLAKGGQMRVLALLKFEGNKLHSVVKGACDSGQIPVPQFVHKTHGFANISFRNVRKIRTLHWLAAQALPLTEGQRLVVESTYSSTSTCGEVSPRRSTPHCQRTRIGTLV